MKKDVGFYDFAEAIDRDLRAQTLKPADSALALLPPLSEGTETF